MSDLESGTTQTTTFIGGTKAQAELQAAPMTQLIASNAVGPDTVYKIAVVDASEEISDPSALGLFGGFDSTSTASGKAGR